MALKKVAPSALWTSRARGLSGSRFQVVMVDGRPVFDTSARTADAYIISGVSRPLIDTAASAPDFRTAAVGPAPRLILYSEA